MFNPLTFSLDTQDCFAHPALTLMRVLRRGLAMSSTLESLLQKSIMTEHCHAHYMWNLLKGMNTQFQSLL